MYTRLSFKTYKGDMKMEMNNTKTAVKVQCEGGIQNSPLAAAPMPHPGGITDSIKFAENLHCE